MTEAIAATVLDGACLLTVPYGVTLSSVSMLNCSIPCHPERSEGSPCEAHLPKADGSQGRRIPAKTC